MSYFERNAGPEELEYLRKSNCGWIRNFPKVCCAKDVTIDTRFDPTELLPINCGKQLQSKILHGGVAGFDEHAWMVLLEYRKGNYAFFGTIYYSKNIFY